MFFFFFFLHLELWASSKSLSTFMLINSISKHIFFYIKFLFVNQLAVHITTNLELDIGIDKNTPGMRKVILRSQL